MTGSTLRKQFLIKITNTKKFPYDREFIIAKFKSLFDCEEIFIVENPPYWHIAVFSSGVSRNTAEKRVWAAFTELYSESLSFGFSRSWSGAVKKLKEKDGHPFLWTKK